MTSPLAHHLPSFPSSAAASPPRKLTPLGAKPGKPEAGGARSQFAEAEERGRRQASEAARAELEAARATDARAFEERLAAERAAWRAEVADRLAMQLDQATGRIEAALSDAVMAVIAPFLDRAMQQRALNEFVQTLARLKAGRDVAIRVTGPDALISALRGPLSAGNDAVEFVPAEGVDVSAVIGDTAIETKLGAWCDRLMAALEEARDG